MRAGLLSEPRVTEFLNQNFVSTWVLVDELKPRTKSGFPFADTLHKNWDYPLDLMFLTSEGEFVTKLNSFHDLPNPHPDVGGHGDPRARNGLQHSDVFLRHAREFLDRE